MAVWAATIIPIIVAMSSAFSNIFYKGSAFRLLDSSTWAHRIPGYLSASFGEITGERGKALRWAALYA